MAIEYLNFPGRAWQPGATNPLEQKKSSAGGRVALLRFAPGFVDAAGCQRSHALFVLSGVLELGLRDRAEGAQLLRAGEGCVIDKGTAHWAKNPGPTPVELFIVSDL